MKMLSGRLHWLMVGLALLAIAQGFATKTLQAQIPSMQGGAVPSAGMMMPDRPMSMAFAGPPPMDVVYAGASGACDTSSTMLNGSGLLNRLAGCSNCGGSLCGGGGGGPLSGGPLGGGPLSGGPLSRANSGCGNCGGVGCFLCGGGGPGANGCLFGALPLDGLGSLAPFSEGGQGSQRWFDLYAGTIGLRRTSRFGGFSTPDRDPVTGVFATSDLVSTIGVQGTPALRTHELDLDKMRYGLELIANLQFGPGANLEARYFGLNNWDVSKTVQRTIVPDLYSNYSMYGIQPPTGFDDTDRSFIHGIAYNSELHSGEVNYRRRWASAFSWAQGSWLAGVRYFDLDERFGFNAVGSNNNTFTFNQLRFFNHDTRTRNQLTGFQIGGDCWLNLVPGIQAGVETKGGIFGNHAEVESQIFANSIPGAREHLQDGKTAYVGELTASIVYRLSYSWSVKTSYNLLYVDNVALAPENYNTRDLSNALGSGFGAFTINRFPFIDVDGEVFYQGWSIGGEFLW